MQRPRTKKIPRLFGRGGTTTGMLGLAFVACPVWSQAQTTASVVAPLSLSKATEVALTANPLSRSAREQLTQAQARVAQAQAQERYQVSFSSSVGVSNAKVYNPPPTQETFGTLVNTITIPLPFGRKPRLGVVQANEQLATAKAQYDAARLSLATQVATAYYDLLRKQALLSVATENRTNAQRQLTEAEKRFRAGDVAELDVLRARSPVAAADAALFPAEAVVTAARQTLNSVLGKPLDESLTVEEIPTAPATLDMTIMEARDRAMKNSPDVRAAEASLRAAEIARRIASLSKEPLYSLQGSDTRSNDQTSFTRLDALQATITIPLSDGGLGRAQVREAESARLQAQAQIEVAHRTAEVTASTAFVTAEASLKQVAAARISQELAQTTYDKTVRGYQTGLFPLTDVLSTQSALAQARIAYTQAVYDAAAAITTLNYATGNLPETP